MSEAPSPVDNPPTQPPTPPANPPTPPSNPPLANNGPSNQDGPLQRLEQSIAGLPEALANVLQERAPKQPAPQPKPTPKQGQLQQSSVPQGSDSPSSANPGTQAAVPGKRKSFSDWWFGT